MNSQPSDLFQAIVEITGTPHFLLRDGRVLYTNPAFERFTGYTAQELNKAGVFRLFAEASEAAEQLNSQPPQTFFETEITSKDGEKRWVALTLAPLDGFPNPAILGTLTDLTAFKQREEALRQSELLYKTVFEMAPDIIYIYDAEGPVLDQNEAAYWMFGLSREEAVGKTGIMTQLTEEDQAGFARIREETFRHGEWRGEMRIKRDLGQSKEFFIMDSHVKVADIGGQKIVIAIARDMTERKKMEEQIRQALQEKETLLREIHHRVKNNMQIISTLLKLQMRNAEDDKTRALFRESQNRILSMAMIHEKLYQSQGLHQIDLKDYVDDLAREVLNSFGDLADGVSLKTAVQEIALGLDTAIPCGLIIIELLSNALKYAFPQREAKEIFIGLDCEDQGRFRLTVTDNGVGLPEDLDIKRLRSLGLRLVSDLARYQLDGEMWVSREKGASVYVRFREKQRASKRETHKQSI